MFNRLLNAFNLSKLFKSSIPYTTQLIITGGYKNWNFTFFPVDEPYILFFLINLIIEYVRISRWCIFKKKVYLNLFCWFFKCSFDWNFVVRDGPPEFPSICPPRRLPVSALAQGSWHLGLSGRQSSRLWLGQRGKCDDRGIKMKTVFGIVSSCNSHKKYGL